MKVVIEKVDDRNAERIMRTEIQDRFVIKSRPSDLLGQFLKKKKKNAPFTCAEIIKISQI